MIKVSIEVTNGDDNFMAVVEAESIRQALASITNKYRGCDLRVTFPIDSETFFAREGIEVLRLIDSGDAGA